MRGKEGGSVLSLLHVNVQTYWVFWDAPQHCGLKCYCSNLKGEQAMWVGKAQLDDQGECHRGATCCHPKPVRCRAPGSFWAHNCCILLNAEWVNETNSILASKKRVKTNEIFSSFENAVSLLQAILVIRKPFLWFRESHQALMWTNLSISGCP